MFHLYPGERLSFLIILLLGAVLGLLHLRGQAEVVWSAFVGGFILYASVMTLGLVMRLLGWLPRMSLTLVALGFYPIYASLLALVGYMMFPLQRPLIDEALFKIDAALGYDWVAAVTWLAQYPDFARALSWVYLSSLPQLLVLVLVLGALGRAEQLHRLLVTGMIAGLVMVAFWSLWPSFGPSAYLQPDMAVMAAAHLLVTPEYGAQLMDLAQNGIGRIEKHQMLGTVAFPSFHILMACLAPWFAWRTWLFWPYLTLSVLMVPATLVHGGHHLVDVAGGVMLFALSYALCKRALQVHLVPRSASRGMAAA